MSEVTSAEEPRKYGTFLGVFIPSILTILGVILFLRTGWVVANAGVYGAILILSLASAITFITGLSTSATATNMKVQGGGVYFMVSRCFGIESGAAIGIPLFLAQGVGITFYTMGFAESLHALFPAFPVPAISIAALLVLTFVSYTYPDLAMKGQLLIFATIVLSLVSFYIGTPIEPNQEMFQAFQRASFWVVFAVFFPAVTGITTGISMSGDLKEPNRSIPLGTLAAVVVGFLIYLLTIIFLDRFATPEQLNADPLLMASLSIAPPLIFVGIALSTLSSALGGLLSAPRTLQAMAKDGLGPSWLAKGYGIQNEPRIATVFTFGLALAINFLGGIDVIAPILTMFFLTSYGALNLAAGLEGMTLNPSWRPSFKTPWTVSIVGAFACLVAMLFIDAQATFVALFLSVAIFYIVRRTHKKKRQWSDIRRGLLLHMARTSVYSLDQLDEEARTWRPNIMVLSGDPLRQKHLIQLGNAFSQRRGFLIVSSIVGPDHRFGELKAIETPLREFLVESKIEAIAKIKASDDLVSGIKNLVQDYGVGALTPNTVMMGCFEGDPRKDKGVKKMAEIIQTIHRTEKNILLIRKPELVAKKSQSRIDVWFGKTSDNDATLLAFGYLLQTSADWVGSELCIHSFAADEAEKEELLQSKRDFIKEGRINARVKVHIKPEDETHFSQIRKHSQDAGIVLMGIQPPTEAQGVGDYAEYYTELLVNTREFPQMVFLLKGESIDFSDIFV